MYRKQRDREDTMSRGNGVVIGLLRLLLLLDSAFDDLVIDLQ